MTETQINLLLIIPVIVCIYFAFYYKKRIKRLRGTGRMSDIDFNSNMEYVFLFLTCAFTAILFFINLDYIYKFI